MSWVLAGAFAAAVLYGLSTALQARFVTGQEQLGLTAAAMLRLLRHPVYLSTIALEVLGFLLSLQALRTLPIFVVQSILCSHVAVTALLATRLVRQRLHRLDVLALVGLSGGLIMVAASSHEDLPPSLGLWGRLLLGLPLVAAVLGGIVALRSRSQHAATLLGFCSGLCFGAADVAARVSRGWPEILLDPAGIVCVVGAFAGLLLSANGMQRGRVAAVAAANVVAFSVLPSAVGVVIFGDRPHPGTLHVATLGYLMTLLAAYLLTIRKQVASTAVTAVRG